MHNHWVFRWNYAACKYVNVSFQSMLVLPRTAQSNNLMILNDTQNVYVIPRKLILLERLQLLECFFVLNSTRNNCFHLLWIVSSLFYKRQRASLLYYLLVNTTCNLKTNKNKSYEAYHFHIPEWCKFSLFNLSGFLFNLSGECSETAAY